MTIKRDDEIGISSVGTSKIKLYFWLKSEGDVTHKHETSCHKTQLKNKKRRIGFFQNKGNVHQFN